MKTLIYWNCNYTIITETDPTQMAYTFMSLRDKMTKPYFLFLYFSRIHTSISQTLHPSIQHNIHLSKDINLTFLITKKSISTSVTPSDTDLFFPPFYSHFNFGVSINFCLVAFFLYITIVIFMNR